MKTISETIEWISVEDETPEDGITVLIRTSNGEVDAGYVDSGEWRWASSYAAPERVTHWAEMPKGANA